MTSSTSIILGTISNGLWLFVLIPQLYTNYKLKRTDSISLSLIISWIYADILVIVSSYLKHSNIMVIYGSVYHILLILLLGLQVLYYRSVSNDLDVEGYVSYTSISALSTDTTEATDSSDTGYLTKSEQKYIFISIATLGLSVPGILVSPDLMADLFGWCALSLYVMSRIPQIMLNYERKSTEGLSMSSFVLINISNYMSLASILVDVHDYNDFLNNIQWIISPFITSMLDIIILYQSRIYQSRMQI